MKKQKNRIGESSSGTPIFQVIFGGSGNQSLYKVNLGGLYKVNVVGVSHCANLYLRAK